MGIAAKAPAKWWGITASDRQAHRFRHGRQVSLCGVLRRPGTALTTDPPLTARPCRTCTRRAHEELN